MSHILLVEARFYMDIADLLVRGAVEALEAGGHTHERIAVPGAFEIPAAIRFAMESGRFDGYVALGCVIRGETSHYDIICEESARGLMQLSLQHQLPLGNGILTVETREQALERADPAKMNKGAGAAEACLALLDYRQQFVGHG